MICHRILRAYICFDQSFCFFFPKVTVASSLPHSPPRYSFFSYRKTILVTEARATYASHVARASSSLLSPLRRLIILSAPLAQSSSCFLHLFLSPFPFSPYIPSHLAALFVGIIELMRISPLSTPGLPHSLLSSADTYTKLDHRITDDIT